MKCLALLLATAAVGLGQYATFAEVESKLADLARLNPDVITLESIGRSAGSRQIHALRVAVKGTTAPESRPAIFVDGGLVVLGTAGDPVAHVTISCTAAGRAGTGGHGHDDAGAYELWLGEPIIVDRGTGAYARDPGLRRRLRGVASHSIVQIDGRAMNGAVHGEPEGLFRREERAKPLMTGYSSSQGGAVAIGHHGFCRAPFAVTVLRSLTLSRDGELEVEDELVGSGEHEVVLRLPLAPGLHAMLTHEGSGTQVRIVRDRDGVLVATCEIEASRAEGPAIAANARIRDDVHAERQLDLVPAVTLEVAFRLSLPARIQHRVRAAPA